MMKRALMHRVAVYLSFVRFSHSVFALPFALAGALLASRRVPVTWPVVGWILVAMIAARSAAMGFNRLVDARLGGFDVLYACQDLDFDRTHGLRSIPVRFGVPAALAISRVMHVTAVACLIGLARVTPLPPIYYAGVAVIAVLLVYEQSLVRADDLSQVKRAFDLNGYVGILYLLVLAASIYAG